MKEFGGRIVETAKIIISPVTDFVSSAITEVKNTIKNSVKRFFHFLNPITWIKGIGKGAKKLLGLGGDDEEKDTSKMGYFRRVWHETGKKGFKVDHSGEMIYDENGDLIGTNMSRRQRLKARRLNRETDMLANKEASKERKRQNYNEKLIAKLTNNQKFEDTKENRQLAIAMARRNGKSAPTFKGEATVKTVQEQIAEEQVNVTGEVVDETRRGNTILASIRDTLHTMFFGSREQKREMAKRASFLSGHDGKVTEEKHEKNAELMEEHGKIPAENVKEGGSKQTRKDASRIHRDMFSDNFKSHGFFGGLKENFSMMKSQIKGSINELKKDDLDAHADGVSNAKAGPAIVGERGPEALYRKGAKHGKFVGVGGPEVINLKGGETIIPNDRISMFADGTSDVNTSGKSKISNKKLMQESDVLKLSIGERILREIILFKKNLTTKMSQGFGFGLGGGFGKNNATIQDVREQVPDEENYDVLENEDEVDTENLQKIGSGLRNAGRGIVRHIPGAGLVRRGMRVGRGIKNAVATGAGAVGELGALAKRKAQKARLAAGKAAQALVSGKSASVMHAARLEEKEKKRKEAQQADIANSLHDIRDDQRKHGKNWLSMFGKKGLLTLGLIASFALLKKFLGGGLSAIFEFAVDKVIEGFNFVMETAPMQFARLIVKGVAKGLNKIIKFGGKLLKPIKSIGKGVAKVAKFVGKGVWNVAKTIGRGFKKVGKFIGQGFKKALGGIKSVLKGIKNGVTGLWRKFTGKGTEEAAEKAAKKGSKEAVEKGAKAAEKKAAKEAEEKLAKETGEAATDATIKNADEIAETAVKNSVDDVAEAGAKGIEKNAGKAATDATIKNVDDVAKNAAKGGWDKTGKYMTKEVEEKAINKSIRRHEQKVAKQAAKNAVKDNVDNVVSATIKNSADDVVESAAKKNSDGLMKTVINYVKSFFSSVLEKIGKKTGKSMGKKSPGVLSKIIKCLETKFPKIANRVSKVLGYTAALAATAVGLLAKEGTFIVLGALDGATGAKRLFYTDKTPDATMLAISTVIGAFNGSTVGTICDIVNELVVAVLGIDMYKELATFIYGAIVGDETKAILVKSQEEFRNEYNATVDTELDAQWKTLQDAGLISTDVTNEEYSASVKSEDGNYQGYKQAFSDYNNEKHKSLGSTIMGGLGSGWNAVSSFVAGSNDETYKDDKGNYYVKNDNGTLQVYDKNGKDIGYIADGNLPKGAKYEKVHNKGLVDHVGDGFTYVGNKVGDGFSFVGKKVGGLFGFGEKEDPSKQTAVQDISKMMDKVSKTAEYHQLDLDNGVSGYISVDGTYYDNKGNHYSPTGADLSLSKITKEQLDMKLKSGEIKPTDNMPTTKRNKAHKESAAIIKKVWDTSKSKLENATQKLQSGITSLFGDLKTEKDMPHKSGYVSVDGTYYSKDGTHYTPVGVKLDSKLTKKQLLAKVKTGELRPVDEIPVDQDALKKKNAKIIEKTWKKGSKKIANFTKNLGSNLTNMFNLASKGDDAAASEKGYRAVDGTFYDSKGNHYSPIGVKIGKISKKKLRAKIKSGELEKATLPKKDGDGDKNASKIGATIKNLFVKSVENAKKGVNKLKETSGAVFKSITGKKSLSDFVGGLFKSTQNNKVWYDPDGNYYKKVGNTYTKYNMNGDVIKRNIKPEKVEKMIESSLLTEGKLVKDTKAKDAVNTIRKALQTTWDVAKNSVDTNLSALRNLLTGTDKSGNSLDFSLFKLKDSEESSSSSSNNKGLFSFFGGNGTGSKRRRRGGRGDAPSTLNGIPYYSQNDSRWADKKFIQSDGTDDGATMSTTGCGPAAMSMVISSMNSKNPTPTDLARYAQESGTRDDSGTNEAFIDSSAQSYGLNSQRAYDPSGKYLKSQLAKGNPMVLLGQSDGITNSPYTNAGHYIVATGLDSNGNVLYNDPRGKSYSGKIDANTLSNTTGTAWSFNKSRGGFGEKKGSIGSMVSKATKNVDAMSKDSFTAQDVILVASNEIGYLEKASNSKLNDKTANAGKNNHTKYEKDVFGSSGSYWCASFVSWCFYTAANKNKTKAGAVLGLLSRSCEAIRQKFISNKRFDKKPQPGDCIFFSGTRHSGANHIGIVESVSGGKVNTIEGNTSGGSGVIDNGGMVARHSYDLNYNRILGYGHPNYDGASNFSGVSSSSTNATTSGGVLDTIGSVASKIGTFGSTLFNALLTGDTKVDWKAAFAENNDSSGSSSNSSSDSGGSVSANIKGGDVPKNVWKFFTDAGYSPATTAGIMGNLAQESGLNPASIQGNGAGPAAGIAQWENYNAWKANKSREEQSRFGNLAEYAKKKNKKWTDLGTQLEYMNNEINTNDFALRVSGKLAPSNLTKAGTTAGTSFEQWKKMDNVEKSTRLFEGAFERAGKPMMDNRIKAAKSYFDKYSKGGSGDGVTTSSKKYAVKDDLTSKKKYYMDSIQKIKANTTDTSIIKRANSISKKMSNTTDISSLTSMMTEIISLLGSISKNSDNLSLLKDIKTNGSVNIMQNTTNNNVSGSKAPRSTTNVSTSMSAHEMTARQIAFGS